MRKLLLVLATLTVVGAGSAVAASTPPQNTVRPTISGIARQGETLTANPGTWSGTQPLTFTFQWLRCDTAGSSCARIIGATSKTYVLTSVDVGNTVRVGVRAENDAGGATATSLPTAVIAAKTPKSISLDVDRSLAVYGQSVVLTGSVANGQAGESVTIVEHRLPAIRGLQVREVATVTTAPTAPSASPCDRSSTRCTRQPLGRPVATRSLSSFVRSCV